MAASRARAFVPGYAIAVMALFFAAAQAAPAQASSFGDRRGERRQSPAASVRPPEPDILTGSPVLARQVINLAGAYADYMQTAVGIGPKFADGAAVSAALRLGAHSERHQLQQGMVAYAAVAALQDPGFVSAVRGFARNASTRDALVRNILADPNYVMTLPGHDAAAGLVVGAMNAQATRLQATGEKIQQASLDIQLKAPWSKKAAPNQASTLADVKQLSTSALVPADGLKAQLTLASTGAQPLALTRAVARPPYTQTVIRGMAIAALAVLGKAGDDDMAYLTPLLVNEGDGFCFNLAKLNLYQCLSVARPHYENMYCLGLHALSDTGRCVRTAVGEPSLFSPIPPDPAQPRRP